jgi:hypothetical protein
MEYVKYKNTLQKIVSYSKIEVFVTWYNTMCIHTGVAENNLTVSLEHEGSRRER